MCNLSDIATGPIDTYYGPKGSPTIDNICIPSLHSDILCNCKTSDIDPLNTSDHEAFSVTLNIKLIIGSGVFGKLSNIKRRDNKTTEQLNERHTYPVDPVRRT